MCCEIAHLTRSPHFDNRIYGKGKKSSAVSSDAISKARGNTGPEKTYKNPHVTLKST